MKEYILYLTKHHLLTGVVETMQFRGNDCMLNSLWDKHMKGIRGNSGSNLGYETDDCPEYRTHTGIIKNTDILISWISYELKPIGYAEVN